MRKNPEPTNLEQLLDRISTAAREKGPVSVNDLLNVLGRRSFGPVLLAAGLVTLAPLIGDIPGVPTIIGAVVFLMAIQLLLGRKHFWLPYWLLRRSVERDKLCRVLEWMRSPAQFIDRFLRPRLTVFAHDAAAYAIAVICMVIAAAMPVMEVVPFSANAAGIVLTIFGLSLIARDGLLALIAFIMTAVTAVAIALYMG